jgi:hypothetical protein
VLQLTNRISPTVNRRLYSRLIDIDEASKNVAKHVSFFHKSGRLQIAPTCEKKILAFALIVFPF